MIGGPKIDAGGGGGQVTVMDSTQSNDSNHDPMNDPIFGGGKTGSETMAEGGAASSVATIDSDTTDVSEKMQDDGIQNTVETFKNLAEDGNDQGGATFDHVDQSNKSDLQGGVNELAKAAQDAVSGGSSDTADGNQSFAKNRAAQAAAAGAGGGSSSGPGGLLEAVVSFLVSLATTLFGGA